MTIQSGLSESINKVVWQFSKLINDKNLSVFVAYEFNEDDKLIADWDNLNLILHNLIQNAVKYND